MMEQLHANRHRTAELKEQMERSIYELEQIVGRTAVLWKKEVLLGKIKAMRELLNTLGDML